MTRLYEGMFLIDNDLVRAGWQDAKHAVVAAIQKHGGTVQTARRWDERRLAYSIAKRNRATFLLAYFELPGDSIPLLSRDLELNDHVLRHLLVRAEAVSEEERKLAEAEDSRDFIVPEPPADDVDEGRDSAGDDQGTGEGDDEDADIGDDDELELVGNLRGREED